MPPITSILTRLIEANTLYEKHHIPKAFLVGSFSRGEETDTSDVDIYIPDIQFHDLYTYMNCKFDFESLLGKTVDIITDDNMRTDIRSYLLSSSISIR
jgi:uncharacterized protein